ncbi:Sodium/hydrogen exchanger family-domain-containing protein [Multifurca ochricompacta]|uniref:Sodium/hydrogen exchanger family-domain-containing protein n=1 Tax=Multifurca ochricompacta TaxID=376703 RepID=A0AAD4M4L1_9AGAM|nr:Sodium/hydrogen exchanger family-domain-containing protein [Multifurca ochricompacta]
MSVSLFSSSSSIFSAFQRRTAPDQGGLLTGKDPTKFNPADPLRLWIIQVGVIIITTQILSLGLRKLRQPRVIAEVLGGILLGPTAFGRIPGFSKHIFPSESIPYLSLVANIGLCLFLFIIGLEIDTAIIRRNARLSATVAAAGVIIPFGLGAALAVPLYKHFIDSSQVSYTHFMLFTGVAYSITAFPVLCRILTELKLLDTTVGIVVLSAGVGNDIIGWTLLALSVALVNAGSGLTALWILLICLGWTLFMLLLVSRVLHWLASSTGSIENGPTIFFMTATILILFGSAFFTDVIGVHAIFGAFLAGIIVPREGGLAIALTEKLEDMVSVIFLPLYFTLSGLSTDLGLLNTGTIWAYTIAICVLAFAGKFGGCTMAAKYTGFSWREASTIGSLMSCKGLIELIVLNVGLSAGILTRLVFSMFVLEALLLTFATTPTVSFLYPPHLRSRATTTGSSFANVRDPKDDESGRGNHRLSIKYDDEGAWKRRFTLILDKLEHLPSMMAITHLLQPPPPVYTYSKGSTPSQKSGKGVEVPAHFGALRLIELADRPSDVMKSSATDALLHGDPQLAIFRTFAEMNGLSVSAALSMVPFDALAGSVGEHVRAAGAQLVLVPWLPSAQTPDTTDIGVSNADRSPFDSLFRTDRSTSLVHSHFVRGVFAQAGTNVALFMGRAPFGVGDETHLFLPFFGGPDDRLALDFVVQLCANPRVRATVVRITKRDSPTDNLVPGAAHLTALAHEDKKEESAQMTIMSVRSVRSTTGFPDTMYGNETAHTRLQSETADNVTWGRYASFSPAADEDTALGDALLRVTFEDLGSPMPLHAALHRARACASDRTIIVVVGRSRRLAVEDHHAELGALEKEHGQVRTDVRKTVGDVGTAFVMGGIDANLLVMQAFDRHSGA